MVHRLIRRNAFPALRSATLSAAFALLAACAAPSPPPPAPAISGEARLLTTVRGLSGPEAVRYDPEQDVYFVANWNGDANALDDNGFISRVHPDGTVDSLRFIAGGRGGTVLHAPRGMWIAGDTLWAADVDAVRGFDRRSGAPLATISFADRDVGFLNDLAAGPDGALYLTDTGRNRIYRIAGGRVSVALADSALDRPNGITRDAAHERFIVVPIGGGHAIFAWRPGETRLDTVGSGTGGRYDGVEVLPDGSILVASQADSSVHRFGGGQSHAIARTGGRPADIGVDTRRGRVAVPFVARDAVEIWELPR